MTDICVKLYCRVILLFVGIIAATSCSKGEDPEYELPPKAKVTFMAPVNGLGDNSYNDNIADGVLSFVQKSGVRLSMLRPASMSEAEGLYRRWLSENEASDSAVMVLGGIAYESMSADIPTSFSGKGCRVLVVESDSGETPEGVSSVYVCRYGAAWLAGAMSREFDVRIMAAAPGFNTLDDAIGGFREGHAAQREPERILELSYLAEGEEGFIMPDSAYRMACDIYGIGFGKTEMIFPLLGESEKGLIRYANYDVFFQSLIIGMDVDQSGLCPRIPFSMVINIGEVVNRYLHAWIEGEDWPKSSVTGLREGDTGIIFNDTFEKNLTIWDDRYATVEIFKDYYNQYLQEAMRKEDEYVGK